VKVMMFNATVNNAFLFDRSDQFLDGVPVENIDLSQVTEFCVEGA